jgi:hypothetical protein
MKKLLFLLAFFCAFLYSQNAYAYDSVYLRGEFNSWGDTTTPFTTTDGTTYTVEELGSYLSGKQFKVYDSNWYGSGSTIALDTETAFSSNLGNSTFPSLTSASTYVVTWNHSSKKITISQKAVTATYTLVSTDAFSTLNGSELTETSTSGLFKLALGGITATANQAFTLSDGTNAIKATTSTSCTNALVAGSTSASNNFIVDAGTYTSLYMQKSGDTYNVLASTNPATPTVTATTSVSGTTVTITATSNIPAANVTSYSISRGGTVLNSSVTPAEDGSFTYTDNEPNNGTYSYTVTATYKECSTLLTGNATSSAVTATITEGTNAEATTASSYQLHAWQIFSSDHNKYFVSTPTSLAQYYYYLDVTADGTNNVTTSANNQVLVKNGDTYYKTTVEDAFSANTLIGLGSSNSKNIFIETGKTYYRLYFKTDGSYHYLLCSTVPTSGQAIAPTAIASSSTVSIACDVPSFLPANSYVKSWTIKEGTTTIASSEDAGAALAYDVTNASVGDHTYTVTLNYTDAAGVFTFTATGTASATVAAATNYVYKLFTWTDATNGNSAFYNADSQFPTFASTGIDHLYSVTLASPSVLTSTEAANGYLVNRYDEDGTSNQTYVRPQSSTTVAANAFLGLGTGDTGYNIALSSGIGKTFYKVYLYTNGTYFYSLASTIPASITSKAPTLSCNASGNVIVNCNVPDSLADYSSHIVGYNILRDGVKIGSLAASALTSGAGTYTDATAVVGTTYNYTVVCKYRDINALATNDNAYTVSSDTIFATVSAQASIKSEQASDWSINTIAGLMNLTNGATGTKSFPVSSTTRTADGIEYTVYTIDLSSSPIVMDGTDYFNLVGPSKTFNTGLVCFRDTWTPLNNTGDTHINYNNNYASKMANGSFTCYGISLCVDADGNPYMYFSSSSANALTTSTPSKYWIWGWTRDSGFDTASATQTNDCFQGCRAAFETTSTTGLYRIMFNRAETINDDITTSHRLLIKDKSGTYYRAANTDAVSSNVWNTISTSGNDFYIGTGKYFGMLLKVTTSGSTTTYQYMLLTYVPGDLTSTPSCKTNPAIGKVNLIGTKLTWANATQQIDGLTKITNRVRAIKHGDPSTTIYDSGEFDTKVKGSVDLYGIQQADSVIVTANYYKTGNILMDSESDTISLNSIKPAATVSGSSNDAFIYANGTFYARVLMGASINETIGTPYCFATLRNNSTDNSNTLASRQLYKFKTGSLNPSWNVNYSPTTDSNCQSFQTNVLDNFTNTVAGDVNGAITAYTFNSNAYYLVNNVIYFDNRSDSTWASGAPAISLENSRLKDATSGVAMPTDLTELYKQANYTYNDPVSGASVGTGSNTNVEWYVVNLQAYNPTYVLGTVTGIDGINADGVKVIGGNEMIMVYGATNVSVFDMTGRLITRVSNVNEIPVASGIYIVHADQATAKVIVK